MFCTLHANKKYWWDRSQSNAEKGKKTKEIKERRRLPLWKTSGMNINIRIWTAAAAIVTVATTVLVQAPTNPIGKNHFKYHKSYIYIYICTLHTEECTVRCTDVWLWYIRKILSFISHLCACFCNALKSICENTVTSPYLVAFGNWEERATRATRGHKTTFQF